VAPAAAGPDGVRRAPIRMARALAAGYPRLVSRTSVALSVLLILGIGLVGALVFPIASPLFLAAVLAAALEPWQRRLARRLGGRRTVAASILTVGVIVAVLLPFAAVLAVVVGEIFDGVVFVRETLRSEGVHGLIEKLPGPLRDIAHRAASLLERANGGGSGLTGQQVGEAAAAVRGAVARTWEAVLGLVFFLIALFFLLQDGPRLIAWLEEVSPLEEGRLREILGEIRKTVVKVVLSTLVTAAVQAVVALVAYLIAGVPQAFFFTLVTFLFALIPVVGAASVPVVIGIFMIVGGQVGAGTFLIVWGLAIVALVDNLLKPILIKGGMEIHGAIVFFSLMSGLALFGLEGLVAGPVILAYFAAVVRIWRRDNPRIATASAFSAPSPPRPPPRGAGRGCGA